MCLLKVGVVEILPYGSLSRSLHNSKLRTTNNWMLLRMLELAPSEKTNHFVPYQPALEKTGWKSIGTTVRTRRPLSAGDAVRTNDMRLARCMEMGKMRNDW